MSEKKCANCGHEKMDHKYGTKSCRKCQHEAVVLETRKEICKEFTPQNHSPKEKSSSPESLCKAGRPEDKEPEVILASSPSGSDNQQGGREDE